MSLPARIRSKDLKQPRPIDDFSRILALVVCILLAAPWVVGYGILYFMSATGIGDPEPIAAALKDGPQNMALLIAGPAISHAFPSFFKRQERDP